MFIRINVLFNVHTLGTQTQVEINEPLKLKGIIKEKEMGKPTLRSVNFTIIVHPERPISGQTGIGYLLMIIIGP